MGATQSSSADGNSGAQREDRDKGQPGGSKICYYNLLGIERLASEEEIKKAYRKKALELHPDRNYGNVEETTKLFAEVQSAYTVLSDPQERAWYDSHRIAILRDEAEPCEERFEHNSRVTTAEDVLRMFTKFDGRMDFSDSTSGFYSFLRDTFDTLSKEEELACEWEGLDPVIYPSFGCANDDYEVTVKPFYAAWSGFATSKSFSWKDFYRLSDAPDRRVRRTMERENKRFREEGIHEFNDSVRSLVAFVKKRDPRYKLNFQSEADRQRILRDAAAAQAARSRAANQVKMDNYKTPEWMKLDGPSETDISDNEEDPIEEQLECIVCKKGFKSEKQYEAHEKSKKHIRAVQQIRREMRKEDKVLNLHDQISQNHGIYNLDRPKTPLDPSQVDINPDSVDSAEGAHRNSLDHTPFCEQSPNGTNAPIELEVNALDTAAKGTAGKALPSSSEDDEHAPKGIFKRDTKGEGNAAFRRQQSSSPVEHLSRRPSAKTLDRGPDPKIKPKLGKAKEKRAKKAAQINAGNGIPVEFTCTACQSNFASKARLFDHIKAFNHAQPKSEIAKNGRRAKNEA